MPQVDSIGAFTGEIVESAISTTAKPKEYPQWVVRLKVEKKFVESPEELKHFGLTEPQYVDYSTYDQEITGFLVLFNDKGPLMNYEQAQKAVGWDGTSFDDLVNTTGKKVLFRVEQNEYNGKTRLQVNWIDAEDASPTRTIKSLDATGLKALSAKFLTKKAPVKVATAKAPTAAAPAPVAPAAASPTAPAKTPAPVPSASTPTGTAAKKVPAAPKAPAAPVVPPAPAADAPTGLPPETTKLEAWTFLFENKGDVEDTIITDAFLTVVGVVADGRTEDQLTGKDWAKVRDDVIKDCQLKVK